MFDWITRDYNLVRLTVKKTITLINTLIQASITCHLDYVMLIDLSDSTLRPLLSTLLSMDHSIFMIWLHFPFSFLLSNSASATLGDFGVLKHDKHALDWCFCTWCASWSCLSSDHHIADFLRNWGVSSKLPPQSQGALLLTWWLAGWTQVTQSDFEITMPLSSFVPLGKFLSHLLCLFLHL